MQALQGFKVTDATIDAYSGKITQQQGAADEYSKKIAEWLVSQFDFNAVDAENISKSADVWKALESYSPTAARILNLSSSVLKRKELDALIGGRETSAGSARKLEAELASLLGGRSIVDYKNARTLAQQEEETRRNEYNAANEAARAAWQDYYNSPSEKGIDITRRKAVRAAEFEAEQRLADIANDEAIAKADAKRAAELAAARGALTSMTGGDLKQALQNIAPGLASTNTKDKAHAEALAEIYTAEQARRSSERVTYKKQYLSDKKFDASEIDAVFEMYDKGIEENNKALQALAKYLLKNGQKYAETTADLKRVKNKLSDMQ